jgi:putative peptide zinc metalloprotease protein
LLLFAAPVPYATLAQGVVRLPETALVRARSDGVVSRVLIRPGATVRRGDPILELDEPTLPAALAVLEAERHELEVRRDVALTTDRVSANLLADQAQRAAGVVALARDRLADSVLRAPRDGVLALPEAESLPGRFVRRGDLIGQELAPDDLTVRVVVPQERIDLVRARTVSWNCAPSTLSSGRWRPRCGANCRPRSARCRARRWAWRRAGTSRPIGQTRRAGARSNRPSSSTWRRAGWH